MTLRVYNTLTRAEEPFETIEPGKVRMYVCGPTVYADAHIGHAMSAMVFDVIRRYLEFAGYQVKHAQNFTDIDDKIINRANAEGRDPNELAEEYINQWLHQTAALHVKPATVYPRATQELGNIHAMIQTLIDKGNAYPMDGDVYYRVRSFKGYGKLSHRSLEDMRAGERVAVDERKEDPMDFALWKGVKPGEPAWDSPWGGGRPGWHIECSAMIKGHLGERIDIHGGGADLIFPHHENEIAQSEAALGVQPFARYWVHNGLLQMKDTATGEIIKMSKSLGNLITIGDLLKRRNGADILRFMVLSANYRTPLTYTEEIYDAATKGLDRLRTALRDSNGGAGDEVAVAADSALGGVATGAEAQFRAAMDDDFNTPNALAVLFDFARAINRAKDQGAAVQDVAAAKAKLRELMTVLGLRPDAERAGDGGQAAEPFIELLLQVRRDLRAAKQWQLADTIRDSMTTLGVALEDSAQGTIWRWMDTP
ncbi:MAG: cysteine--tRNA ligase [Chloroflexota bacterium]|nr:cysteine--tRNA ligase [Chloroflexota bacterium]